MIKKIFILQLLFASIFAKDRLNPGECLFPEKSLISANGCFKLVMQSDGNLVAYRQSDGKPTFRSETPRTCTNRACMQRDGNFVAYDCHNKPTWSSSTHNNEGSSIVMQNDGNLVIYAWQSTRAIWNSNTVTYC